MTTNIQTGVTSSIKAGAVDAAKEQEMDASKAKIKAEAMAPRKGDILYIKQGEPVFNTIYGLQNKQINFIGGRYLVKEDDPDLEEIKTALAHFVKQGIITSEEGK